MYLNNRKITNHPPSPENQREKKEVYTIQYGYRIFIIVRILPSWTIFQRFNSEFL